MTPPAGHGGEHVRQQGGVGERGGLAAPAALELPVGEQRDRDQQQPEEDGRLAEAHATAPGYGPPAPRPLGGSGAPAVAWAAAARAAAARAGRHARREPAAAQEARELEQPVPARREHEVLRAGPAQLARDLVALGLGGAGEALAHAPLGRVDLKLAPGLRVDEPQLARRRELLLAGVADLDGQRPVAAAQRAQGIRPVARAAEVGDDHDEPALARDGGGAAHGVAGRGRPGAVGLGLGAQLGQQRQQPAAALLGRAAMRAPPPPKPTTPSRLPRRVATWPIASATPSATSALRRSAVPNVIEAEVSSTSHVVSARSPTCTRTCGSRMRAVTFQSMCRTSSPGW